MTSAAEMAIETRPEAVTITATGRQRAINGELVRDFLAYIDRSDKTQQTYLVNLKQFLVWMRYQGITDPTRADIILYRDWLASEHAAIQADGAGGWMYRTDKSGKPFTVACKPNTVRLYLRSVKQFFSWAAVSGHYPDIARNVHAPKVSSDDHKKDAFTAAELLEIEGSITRAADARAEDARTAAKDAEGRSTRATEQGKRLYAMYLLTVNAGLRTIELHRANVRDLEEKGGQMWLYVWGKGRTEPDQKKPIAREVADALKDYLKSRADGAAKNSPLFVSTGNRSGGQRIEARTISTMLKKAMQAAGYDSERLTAHSLRHSTGSAVMEITGNNIYMAQSYMRHKDPKTTEIYLHTDTKKEEAQTAQRLYDHIHGKDQGAADVSKLFSNLTPLQMAQLIGMAAAMATAAKANA